MKTSTTTSTPPTKPKFPLLAAILIGLAVLAGLVWGGMVLFGVLNKSTTNYAEEVAKPLEEALVKAGGVKKCSLDDPGFGPDNWRPSHTGVYQVQSNYEDVVELIKNIGADNKLVFKTEPKLEHVDSIIMKDEDKVSPYKELNDGKMYISVVVGTAGDDGTCGGSPLVISEKQTVVLIQVSLPDRKVTH